MIDFYDQHFGYIGFGALLGETFSNLCQSALHIVIYVSNEITNFPIIRKQKYTFICFKLVQVILW
jgi:hypothetical protein